MKSLEIEYAVITWVPNPFSEGNGNLCNDLAVPYHDETNDEDTLLVGPIDKVSQVEFESMLDNKQIVNVMREVFHVGEILILDGSGRELGYPGRKPSKWSVVYKTFSDIKDAITKSIEMRN